MRLKFKSTRLHIALAALWMALVYPTVKYWSQSVLWVGLMSCYALVIGHISSYEAAASAGVDDETHRKLNALAKGQADLMAAVIALLPEGAEMADELRKDREELLEVVGIEKTDT